MSQKCSNWYLVHTLLNHLCQLSYTMGVRSHRKKNKIRKNRDRLKFSHRMHQCQTDRLWALTQCQFYKFSSNKLFRFYKNISCDLIVGFFLCVFQMNSLFYKYKSQENLHCSWIYSLLSNNLPVNTMLAKTKQIAHTCEMQSGSSGSSSQLSNLQTTALQNVQHIFSAGKYCILCLQG